MPQEVTVRSAGHLSHRVDDKLAIATYKICKTYSFEIMFVACVRYFVLLDCEPLIHVDFLSLFVIHVWYPRFPLNAVEKYLI